MFSHHARSVCAAAVHSRIELSVRVGLMCFFCRISNRRSAGRVPPGLRRGRMLFSGPYYRIRTSSGNVPVTNLRCRCGRLKLATVSCTPLLQQQTPFLQRGVNAIYPTSFPSQLPPTASYIQPICTACRTVSHPIRRAPNYPAREILGSAGARSRDLTISTTTCITQNRAATTDSIEMSTASFHNPSLLLS